MLAARTSQAARAACAKDFPITASRNKLSWTIIHEEAQHAT